MNEKTMNRKDFLSKSVKVGLCCSGMLAFASSYAMGTSSQSKLTKYERQLEYEKGFIENWLSDLLDTMEQELDEDTCIKLIEGCGKGCFRRHKFKTDIAEQGKGDKKKLIEAMKSTFEVWEEGDKVHVRFGEKSPGCYCPVLRNRPLKENDIHCNCTKATQQAIFETAMGRPIKVDILESVRRGDLTCHFLVHMD